MIQQYLDSDDNTDKLYNELATTEEDTQENVIAMEEIMGMMNRTQRM